MYAELYSIRHQIGGGELMPFVDITLARGKSPEYLEAVSQAVHSALVAEMGMKPDDYFQIIHHTSSAS
jgi:Tautomerase enzyme